MTKSETITFLKKFDASQDFDAVDSQLGELFAIEGENLERREEIWLHDMSLAIGDREWALSKKLQG